MFDPIGLISTITVKFKILFQIIWVVGNMVNLDSQKENI